MCNVSNDDFGIMEMSNISNALKNFTPYICVPQYEL